MTLPLHTAQSPREVLDLMEELYKDEKRWTKHFFACDEFGIFASEHGRFAFSFCLEGAVDRLAQSGFTALAVKDAIRKAIPGKEWITKFNDSPSTTIDDIRRVIREAKERV